MIIFNTLFLFFHHLHFLIYPIPANSTSRFSSSLFFLLEKVEKIKGTNKKKKRKKLGWGGGGAICTCADEELGLSDA